MVMSSMRIPSNRVSENQSKRMNNYSAYHIILFHAAIELVKSLCYECMQSWSKAPCTLILLFPYQICNSPYCQPYNSYDVSSENLILDWQIIPKLKYFFILITYLVDIILIL